MALSESYLKRMTDAMAHRGTASPLAASLAAAQRPAAASAPATPAAAAGAGANGNAVKRKGASAADLLLAAQHKADAENSKAAGPAAAGGAGPVAGLSASAPAPGGAAASADAKSGAHAHAPSPAQKLAVNVSGAKAHGGGGGGSGGPSPAALARYGSRKAFRLEDVYDVKEKVVLGTGATATVKLCVHKQSKRECAVKCVAKGQRNFDDAQLHAEISVMFDLKHPNVLELLDVFETADHLYLVMELAYGGELFERLVTEKKLNEKTAAAMARRLFDAVAYLHSKGVVHRDLKPENILFADHSKTAEIKISDFGLSCKLFSRPDLARAKSALGTRGYAAPEVFSGQPYDERADVFSLGVIIYTVLCGVPPFCRIAADDYNPQTPFWIWQNNNAEPVSVGHHPDLEFPALYGWNDITPDAMNFLELCLEVDPKKRPRSYVLLHHPWLKESDTYTMQLQHVHPAYKQHAVQCGTWKG